ncbi:MAG: HAD family phosphatase [Erysipelotrichaceae bacterium]|nr:HAD family phosphatase [Erysipelotrichaceae bacterium]
MDYQLKNIIFDMGNVIVDFNPEKIVEAFGVNDPADKDLLLKAIFYTKEWHLADRGEMSFEEICEIAKTRLPQRLYPLAEKITADWYQILPPIKGMADLIRKLKAEGFHIYLLSNAALNQPVYWKDTPGNECFEGTIISAFERCVKPDEKIYRILLDRYGLIAEECLFIDDSLANIEAANKLGFKTYHFHDDADKLEEYINQLKEG